MIENYIPSGEYGAKVAAILKPYENNLYAVGSNGRNKAYDLKSEIKGYDFVLDAPSTEIPVELIDALGVAFPDKVNRVNPKPPTFIADCETFFLTIRVQPLAVFLRYVKYAGDMLAVSVKDGALICCPEFMTVPPMIQIRVGEGVEDSVPVDDGYDERHKLVLKTFHDEIVAKISKANEPATS